MGDNTMDAVVAELYAETFDLWDSVRSRLTEKHDHGFKILYGPPRFAPETMIIGMQPGGDASNIKDAELRRPSPQNEYLSESWPLAVELRKRFSEQFLQEAIGTNVIYFRSPSLDHWRKIEVQLREHLEEFCLRQTYRLINTIKPKRILLLGWDTLEQMGAANFREIVSIGPVNGRRRRKRLLQFGKIQNIPTFAIPQPSAGWKFPPVTDKDWQAIAAEIDALGSW